MARGSPSSGNDEPVKSKKRSRKTSGDDDGGAAKKRGRPRVDTEDATAADRRRTQIRLAQRAYRQRKETTIASLKRRVGELHSTVAEMNSNFLRFNESAINSGISSLRPELARELRATAEILSRLAADAATSSNFGDDEDGDVEEVVSETIKPKPATTTISAPLPSSQPAFMQLEQDHLDMSFGYTRIFEGRSHQLDQRDAISSFLSTLPNHPPQFHQNQQEVLPFGFVPSPQDDASMQPYQNNQVSIPCPPKKNLPSPRDPSPIPAPFTYSFQETTFARRLQRYAIERGYHLLSYSHARPDRYEKVFRLSLLLATREQIMARSRSILTRESLDSLEFWQTPFIHMGGAGTHYPQRDRYGNIVPIPNAWTVRRIGPLPNKVLLSNSEGVVHDVEFDIREFDGEWLDAHDVQGYLEEKGFTIDPQSSFAEALVDVNPAPDPQGHNSPLAMDLGVMYAAPQIPTTQQPSQRGTSPFSSMDGSGAPLSMVSSGSSGLVDASPATPPQVVETPKVDVESRLNTYGYGALPSAFGYDFSAGMGQGGESTGGFFDMDFSIKPGQKKKSVTIDVNKLVEELVNRCRCLGRSPGFRRDDVDIAFNASIISALG